MRVVNFNNPGGRGNFFSNPKPKTNKTPTRTQGKSTTGESKNHRKGCWPIIPQMPPITA
jgi:hypothetical protein